MELVWEPTLVVGQAAPTADPPDDAALMAAYRGGDGQAFEVLYRRHRAPLYRFIARQLRDRGEAEEVFQEVWMAVVKGRERYQPSARFLTFLFAIAHRRIADRARKAVRRPQAPMPGELLDRRILKAAETQYQRRRILPLAAALAACLMLALYTERLHHAVAPAAAAQLDTSTFGLYEGRGYAQARPIAIHQRPGGFGSDEVVSP